MTAGTNASGTFAWSPAFSDVIYAAYGRCQNPAHGD